MKSIIFDKLQIFILLEILRGKSVPNNIIESVQTTVDQYYVLGLDFTNFVYTVELE